MPISLRHLTADSTWLITLTSPQSPPSHKPYIILVDPWIEGPSPVWHPKFALNHHTVPSSVSNLSELSSPPDLLLISQTKTDHCNELTCRQLPKAGIQVYAVPGADSIIRGWKHFDPANVHRLRPFTSRKTGRVSRIPIYRDPRPPTSPKDTNNVTTAKANNPSSNDESADTANTFEKDPNVAAIVELAFLPALKPWELPSIHIGLGITYTPIQDPITNTNDHSKIITAILPPSSSLSPAPHPPQPTPPHPTAQTPITTHASTSTSTLSTPPPTTSASQPNPPSASPTPPPPPPPPNRFPRRASQLARRRNPHSANLKLPGRKSATQTESILYTPHGVPVSALSAYFSSIPLPLTALLHCFVRVDNPRWLGGVVSTGAPNAFRIIEEMKQVRAEQARRAEEPMSPKSRCSVEHPLGVRYLVATHDEEVAMEGFCSHFVKKEKWDMEDMEREIRRIAAAGKTPGCADEEEEDEEEGEEKGATGIGGSGKMWIGPAGVRLLELGVGEDATLV
ncbi:hypothetical protein DRE_00254 [Drechslerella stenobrocha 248]|uniref:Uncharacterized protein n=1 Tax=Drechslerella stenobrocha 248 TaxID=1043628 RepID=W7HZK5_9PEZI|nr:hypothetical protein DRE_00254 [Drechslerella stenobrocha 248]